MNWKSIIATALVTGIVTLVTTALLFWWQEKSPRLIYASTRSIPFDEVPESYAREGGEGDRTLETWRPMYWRYIVSECGRIGREPRPQAPLIMERFRVVFREAFGKP